MERAAPAGALDAEASVLGMLAALASLGALSFLAPSSLELLHR